MPASLNPPDDTNNTASRSITAHQRKMAYQRERIAAWTAIGLCRACGQHPAAPDRALCDACLDKAAQRTARYRAAQKQMRQEATQSAPDAPTAPVCTYCGSHDLVRRGKIARLPLFHCRACNKRSAGKPPKPTVAASDSANRPAVPVPAPCPYCDAVCLRKGTRSRGHVRYRCTGCGRWNTNLQPDRYERRRLADTPRAPVDGPIFPHKMTFYLGYPARDALNAYCQRHRRTRPQALRDIFRAAADRPLAVWSSGRRVWDPYWEEYRTVITGHPRAADDTPISPQTRVPDVRRETTVARLADGNRLHRPVAVALQISLALDDRAKQGLLKTMKARSLNHQQAARVLVAEAK